MRFWLHFTHPSSLQIAPLIRSGLEEGAQTFLQKYFAAANVSIAWRKFLSLFGKEHMQNAKNIA